MIYDTIRCIQLLDFFLYYSYFISSMDHIISKIDSINCFFCWEFFIKQKLPTIMNFVKKMSSELKS